MCGRRSRDPGGFDLSHRSARNAPLDGSLSAQGEHRIDARCPARRNGARQETDTNERQSNEREGRRVHGTHSIQETGKCARAPLQLPGIFGGKRSPVCVEIHGRRGIESGWHNSGIWRHGNGPTEPRAHPTSALGRLRSPDPDAFRSMKLTLWVMIELKVSESTPG